MLKLGFGRINILGDGERVSFSVGNYVKIQYIT